MTCVEFRVVFNPLAKKALDSLDTPVRIRILKKTTQLQREDLDSRHLRAGLPFFVEDIGQYRVCFEKDEQNKKKIVRFVGDHKEYEKWYKSYK